MTADLPVSAPLLGVYGLSFGAGARRILDEVSFELEAGELCALVGPNGSGKTTLLKAIAGMILAQGQLRWRGNDLSGWSASERARNIAYVPPELRADFPLTARETVRLGRICRGRSAEDEEIVRQAMEACLCWSFRDRDLQDLSGGERQLVALARALAQQARLLLLDEALSRMDLNHQEEIGKMLAQLTSEKRAAVLMVSHDVNLASEWAGTAIALKAGAKVAQGKISDVITPEVFSKLYPGVRLLGVPHPVTGAPKLFFSR